MINILIRYNREKLTRVVMYTNAFIRSGSGSCQITAYASPVPTQWWALVAGEIVEAGVQMWFDFNLLAIT
jgi:hypothetical protein